MPQILDQPCPWTTHTTVIDTVHEHIHEGKSFYAFDVVTLAAGATFEFVVNTNDTHVKHSFLQAYASEELEIWSYENAVTSTDGTSQPMLNRNRNSSNVSTATMYINPTGTDVTGATIVRHVRVGSKNTFSDVQSVNELVIKSNTKYVVRFINRGSQTTYLNWQWFWYECPDCEQS